MCSSDLPEAHINMLVVNTLQTERLVAKGQADLGFIEGDINVETRSRRLSRPSHACGLARLFGSIPLGDRHLRHARPFLLCVVHFVMEPCASAFSCLDNKQVEFSLPAAGETSATQEHRRHIERAICGSHHDSTQLVAQTSPCERSIECACPAHHDRAHAKEVVELS